MSGMIASTDPLAAVMRDVERYRTEQRNHREAGIREAAARQSATVGMLRGTGLFKSDDPLMRSAPPAALGENFSRGDVFKFIQEGGDRATLPPEAAQFVRDYDASKSAW
jgi:hypothetical protein